MRHIGRMTATNLLGLSVADADTEGMMPHNVLESPQYRLARSEPHGLRFRSRS